MLRVATRHDIRYELEIQKRRNQLLHHKRRGEADGPEQIMMQRLKLVLPIQTRCDDKSNNHSIWQ